MLHPITLKILIVILLCLYPMYGHGYDYFTADQDPSIMRQLRNVDNYHTDKVMPSVRDGRMNVAIAELRYTLDNFPNHPQALMLMDLVGRLTKEPSLALPYYEKALKLYPQYALTHAQYGTYLVNIGQIEAGIAKLKQAIEIDPKLAVAHAWLAIAYSKNGAPELARQAAERAKGLGYRGKIPVEE